MGRLLDSYGHLINVVVLNTVVFMSYGDLLTKGGRIFGPDLNTFTHFTLVSGVLLSYFVVVVSAKDVKDDWNAFLYAIVFLQLVVVLYAYQYINGGACYSSSESPECDIDGSESIYFSLVTLTTLGFGDIVPKGPTRLIAATQAMLGLILMPLLFYQFTSFASDFRKVRREASLPSIKATSP